MKNGLLAVTYIISNIYSCVVLKHYNYKVTSLLDKNGVLRISRVYRIIILLLISVHTISANAAIPEHINFNLPLDTLFYKGISLHKTGRYKEAIPYFINIINDSTYMKNRHQMQSYARMWLGNSYLKMNQSDSIKGEDIIYFSEPLDPRIMENIDSLSIEGMSIYASDLEKCIEIFELRQTLLERKIPNMHPWLNGGRLILMKLYKERLFPINRGSRDLFLDESNSIIVAKKFAQLAEEYYINCKENYICSPIVVDIEGYYNELFQLLWLTSSTCYLNQISEISVNLIEEINTLTSLYPDLIENNIYHNYNMGYVYYNLGESLNGNPNPRINSNEIDWVKKAICFYNNFNAIVLQRGEQNEYQLTIFDRLLECYSFLCHHPESESNNLGYDLPQYNYYNLEESNDSIDKKYQENVNNSLTLDLVSNVVYDAAIINHDCINDRYMDDLSINEKEYVRLWIEKSQYLKTSDINEYMDYCLLDCYKRFHLLKDKLQFNNSLYNYANENASKLKYKYYYQFYQLSECAKTCYDLANPLFIRLYSACKHTCDEKEMNQYVQKFFSYTQIFKQLYMSITTEIPNLEFIERNNIEKLYQKLLIDEAGLLFKMAKYKDEINMYIIAKDAISNVMNFENYDDYLYEYSKSLSKCKVKIGDSNGLNEINDRQTNNYNEIITTFKYASADNRRIIWNQFLPQLEENIMVALLAPNSNNTGELVFNSLLYKKSILLSSDNNFLDAIKQCKSDDLEFKNAKNDYLSLVKDAVPNFDAISKLEIQLLPYVKDINYNKSLKVDWKDIRSAISHDQAAIEFGIVDSFVGPKKLFACIIKQKADYPILVILNDYEDSVNPLDTILISSIHEKLGPYLTDINCIFFSPDGIIHQLPIEHFCGNHSMWIRLSSTRELLLKNTPSVQSRYIALFGGIDYDSKMPNENPDMYNSNISGDRELSLPAHLRGGVSYLPYTLEEVESISNVANKFDYTPLLYCGTSASESNLELLLTKKKPYYFHIASHGFYYTQKDIYRVLNIKVESFEERNSFKSENEALLRCGLLFSGANLALSTNLYSNKPNDGILTGIESQQLDFSDVNLITLSACQTGLGDISSDGVLGLQRSFKKAGANSILMSLWKVDDRATQMLMTKFYEFLLSGKTKLESLSLAQKYVREYEEEVEVSEDSNMTASQRRRNQRLGEDVVTNTVERVIVKPFADPKYWAAFILLDALD